MLFCEVWHQGWCKTSGHERLWGSELPAVYSLLSTQVGWRIRTRTEKCRSKGDIVCPPKFCRARFPGLEFPGSLTG